jgi:hypothetical protein
MSAERVKQLSDKTESAFSFSRYGATEWRKGIAILISHGWSDGEIEAALRSKWTRWAADENGATGEAIGEFAEDPRGRTEAAAMWVESGRATNAVHNMINQGFAAETAAIVAARQTEGTPRAQEPYEIASGVTEPPPSLSALPSVDSPFVSLLPCDHDGPWLDTDISMRCGKCGKEKP